MLNRKQKTWTLVNAILMSIILLLMIIQPKVFFDVNENVDVLEVFVMLVLLSSILFFLSTFFLSYVKIRKTPACQGFAIFHLLGAGLSIVFIMILKVMADELAHQWNAEIQSIWGHGEYLILLISVMFICGIEFLFALSGKKNT